MELHSFKVTDDAARGDCPIVMEIHTGPVVEEVRSGVTLPVEMSAVQALALASQLETQAQRAIAREDAAKGRTGEERSHSIS